MKSKGIVYLVGAGPGDAGLLTLRGAELIGRADVLVYDALVNPDLVRLAPRTAEIIYGGKRARDHAIPQDELNQLLVGRARQGKTVVRLKGGDPYVFGRGGEEAEELAAAGIPFEVVPGISSVIAAANYAGIPLTHRDLCSSFTVITGHEDPTKPNASLDYARLAQAGGTIVILMGVERIRAIAESLVAAGLAPATPVGMIRWGTTGQQQSIEGTLATIADLAAGRNFTAPAITVIGEVVRLRDKLNWFERRPLFGQRIVVTRAWDQAGPLSHQFLELGAEVLEIPTIKIQPPDDRLPLVEAIQGIGEYDWLVFTSSNAVTTFFDYFLKAFDDIRALGNIRLAAVGPSTAAKLRELRLKVDAVPEDYRAAHITAAIAAHQSIENVRVLLARAQVATPELPKALEELGAIVDDVAIYKTVPETEDPTGGAAKLLEGGAHWITFTSGSTVEHFNARINLALLLGRFPGIRFASIGPETTKALTALGLRPAVEAKPHSIDGLVRAVTANTPAPSKR